MRAILLFALIAAPAFGAERTVGIGSFDRLRVDGPIEVRVTTGASPAARITGGRDAIEAIDVRLDGRTLVIRPAATSAWGERPHGSIDREPLTVSLGTPSLAAISSVAGARITATAAKGDRIDLSVTGAGAVAVDQATGTDLNATIVGAGTITVAGRTTRARLVANGPATLDAAKLEAGDLIVLLDGTGSIAGHARYTAQISNTGVGSVTVTGNGKCTIRRGNGGPVTCGTGN